ncbi:MAG: EF-hand domain-containing protein [Betaproteobacteria bacterium]|nr:EF-hand domain-containing protein [Betaproteobacteria bacterium]
MKLRIWLAIALAAAACAVAADDREVYNRRAADADMAAFRALDLNGDGVLTRDEARGDLGFGPRFNDADINRDGVVTPEEMRRYIEATYGVKPAA